MRLAVISDIHGNLTALEAVIADLKTVEVDLVAHGGDLVANGARPAQVIDIIRELGWPGVCGNTDEMLWRARASSRTRIESSFERWLITLFAPAAGRGREAGRLFRLR